MEGNNISGEIAHLRDVFLEAEKEYLDELKQQPQYASLIERLNKTKGGTELAHMAIERIEKIENGMVKPEDLEKVETEITIILASIEDRVREKGERELTMTPARSKDDDDFER